MSRYLVTGAGGQLGQALVTLLGDRVVFSGDREALDVRDAAAVERVVREAHPDVVVNAAAYNGVDQAEGDVAEALAVNAAAPAHLARASRETGALLVHVSTDYVFDGRQTRPYAEEDFPHPVNAYGVSKLAGEMMVAASGCPHLVVRTSGIFGAGGSRAKGGSFVERILARARGGESLRVVVDQVFSPTYAPDLAAALVRLVEHGARGLFHVTNSGSCSWHGLASAALAASGVKAVVAEIRSSDLEAAARRPAYSVLSNARYVSLGLPTLRPWQESLQEFLAA